VPPSLQVRGPRRAKRRWTARRQRADPGPVFQFGRRRSANSPAGARWWRTSPCTAYMSQRPRRYSACVPPCKAAVCERPGVSFRRRSITRPHRPQTLSSSALLPPDRCTITGTCLPGAHAEGVRILGSPNSPRSVLCDIGRPLFRVCAIYAVVTRQRISSGLTWLPYFRLA